MYHRTTNRTNPQKATPGFAIRIESYTDLGIAFLVAEDEGGAYEPLGPVASIAEAREIAGEDLRHRMQELDRGGEPMCPALYKVWAQGLDGYAVAVVLDPSTL
ncbi:MAG: hypothetical protein ABI972_31515 [Acidobacteriota bacterium]